MAENKIFAGPRIRRIRRSLDLTQAAMAGELGISPSYLNLIERNQRPLTVQLLLKLASTYKIDLDELRAEIGAGAAALKEVFADPLLADEIPGPQEILEVADAAPNVAAAVAKLYRAYREQQQRLSDLSSLLAQRRADSGDRRCSACPSTRSATRSKAGRISSHRSRMPPSNSPSNSMARSLATAFFSRH